jgi:hypothetical protein
MREAALARYQVYLVNSSGQLRPGERLDYAGDADAIRGFRRSAPGGFRAELWCGGRQVALRSLSGIVSAREKEIGMEPTHLEAIAALRDHVIKVTPVEGGWSVESALTSHPLLFFSGARAEAQARSLAEVVAKTGHDAQVVVHDRRNMLVGTVRFFAEEPLPEARL